MGGMWGGKGEGRQEGGREMERVRGTLSLCLSIPVYVETRKHAFSRSEPYSLNPKPCAVTRTLASESFSPVAKYTIPNTQGHGHQRVWARYVGEADGE